MSENSADVSAKRPSDAGNDDALWQRFRGRDGQDLRISPEDLTGLSHAVQAGPLRPLPDLIPPDRRRTDALMKGIWRIGSHRLVMEAGQAPWSQEMPSRHFADRIHRFDWLSDLAAGLPDGPERAGMLLDDWISRFGTFDGFAWRISPTAARIWNWLRCGGPLFGETTPPARTNALFRQLRWLEAVLAEAHQPSTRWDGAVTLAAGALCLQPGFDLSSALSRLEAEAAVQILADGGHVSRSPARTLSALTQLQTIEKALKEAGKAVPEWMTRILPRLGGMVLFFREGDGALDPFNDGDESMPELVEAALSHLAHPPRRFFMVPKSGFQKIERGTLRFVLDCGSAPDHPFADEAHAGALGFTLSDGCARIVTSCGFSPETSIELQAAVRRTSAHSTLTLCGRDSAVFARNEATGLLSVAGPESIATKRLEEGDQIWLDAQHAGFKEAYGLLHRRRIFIEGHGDHLRGEDALARPVAHTPSDDRRTIPFEIRFHLHPTVTADIMPDHILLTSAHGPVWRFKTSQEGARVEKSLYLARGVPESAQQIVLVGHADPNGDGSRFPNLVRWAFLRHNGRLDAG